MKKTATSIVEGLEKQLAHAQTVIEAIEFVISANKKRNRKVKADVKATEKPKRKYTKRAKAKASEPKAVKSKEVGSETEVITAK